jgi:hypothetical protein
MLNTEFPVLDPAPVALMEEHFAVTAFKAPKNLDVLRL